MIDFITTPYAIDDLEKLKEAGATSVIIATPFFSVRGVHTFDSKQLACIKEECTRLGLRMLCLVNRFFVEAELPLLREHLAYLKHLDVDGIYYGDECVLFEADKLGIKDKLIYNPDTLITNHSDVQYYLDEGISMVTISKDITLDEICEIAQMVNGECEIILHGRVNIMHSKRNLLTSYMKFVGKDEDLRNNNHLYLMEETRNEHMPIVEDETGTHVYSGYTLASFEEIKTMVDAGVSHFRIDGIFHDITYVLEALTLYKKVLDNIQNGSEVMEAYMKKYESDHVTHGFYYTKTSKVKEE